MEVINVPDISIVRGNSLHSLRDQKIVHQAVVYGFETGSGIMKEGRLYVLEGEYAIKMVTSGRSINLQLLSTGLTQIDWGDGEISTWPYINDPAASLNKTYADNTETHTIIIKSAPADISFLLCTSRYLSKLNVGSSTNLETLNCSNNLLKSLDLSRNTNLKSLECYENPLTSLDISHNTALTHLDCHNTELTSLNVSQNTELITISVSGNNLNLIELANSLPDRSGKDSAQLAIWHAPVSEISPICTAKNWVVISQA